MVKFTGVLKATPRGAGGGTLVLVPSEVATELGLKGKPKVKAVIGGLPYRGSVMSLGDGTYGLGVLKSIMAAAGVKRGDSVTVELGLDTARRGVEPPPHLARELERDPRAAAAWKKLSYTRKKEMASSLEGVKRPQTRERHLVAILRELRAAGTRVTEERWYPSPTARRLAEWWGIGPEAPKRRR
jgi:hypothetical protein